MKARRSDRIKVKKPLVKKTISEEEKNRLAWASHERFIKSAIKQKVKIKDVYGNCQER